MFEHRIAQHGIEALIGKTAHIVGVDVQDGEAIVSGFAGAVYSNFLARARQRKQIEQGGGVRHRADFEHGAGNSSRGADLLKCIENGGMTIFTDSQLLYQSGRT